MTLANVAVLGFAFFLLSVTTLQAIPVISIDLDPTTAGIQSTLTVRPGDTFTIDVVYTGDGAATFDTTIVDVAFNDAGSILALGVGPTPGHLQQAVWLEWPRSLPSMCSVVVPYRPVVL